VSPLFEPDLTGLPQTYIITAETVAIRLQLRADRYVAWRHWFAVSMVAVFGTRFADVAHVGLGVPYAVSTAFFAAIFVWRYAKGATRADCTGAPARSP
jgi:uncharacterized membrane-anchored protein